MAAVSTSRTRSEQERRARVVHAAEAMLSQDGEHGLQMKQLAERADVALAALVRLGRALARIESIRLTGETAGERAADLMIRQFGAVQRDAELATALQRVSHAPDRSTSEYIEGISRVMEQLALAAIAQGGAPVSEAQQRLLPIFLAASVGAINHWLSGVVSAAAARSQIRAAGRLLDLPPEIVREYLSAE
jgi:AcrR family transcriptional regulator